MNEENISISQEKEVAILRDFKIGSESTIKRICSSILSDENELYIYLDHSNEYFVTEVLSIDFEERYMYLGTPYEKKQIAQCNEQTQYCIVTFPEGVKVQFDGIGIKQTEYQRASSLRIALPKFLVRIQRRNYFRVHADDIFRAQAILSIDSLHQNFQVTDFSLAGCGLNVHCESTQYKSGHIFENVRLSLPDSQETVLLNLKVKNIKNTVEEPDTTFLGCEIIHIQRASERRLQKFLLSTERRQRAMQNSID